jgi:hypothetical protein
VIVVGVYRHLPEDDHSLSESDDSWGPSPFLELSRFDRVPPPAAGARLLGTPRALKHALGQTYISWQILHGEVDFDDLLAVNMLRYGADWAFEFILRHWNQVHDDPRLWRDREHVKLISTRLKAEWKLSSRGSKDQRAAFALLEFILPMITEYFGKPTVTRGSRSTIQGIGFRRYWDRVLSEEIDPDETRDQRFLQELKEWLKSRNLFSALIEGIFNGGDYLEVWRHYVEQKFFSEPSALLQLFGQILSRFRTAQGAIVSVDQHHAAFTAGWVYANRLVPKNEASRIWLEHQIREAMPFSLQLVLDLYYYWGSSPKGVLLAEDRKKIRLLIYQLCKDQWHSGEDLMRICSSSGTSRANSRLLALSAVRGRPHWSVG